MLIIAPGQEAIFSIFFNMKVCCVFSLESPHGGDSNNYTQDTIFNIKKKKITLNYSKSAANEVNHCARIGGMLGIFFRFC